MNKLKKVIFTTTATALIISTSVMAANVGTMNNFTSGTPAVANDVNANFTEQTTQINDNDTRISALENNSGKTFTTSAFMRIPNRATNGTAGATYVTLLFANKSITTCDMYIAKSQRNWSIGDNTFGLTLAPTYNSISLAGKTFAINSSTTVLVQSVGAIGDINSTAFVDYTVQRDEANVLDTCGPNDILLYGARVFDPNNKWHFIPLSEMKVK